MFIDKLGDIVNKYKSTYYITIKIKPVDVKTSTYVDFDKKNNKGGPKFKVGDHVRMSKIKTFLQKVTCQIGLKWFLSFQKLKILFRGHMLLVTLKCFKNC